MISWRWCYQPTIRKNRFYDFCEIENAELTFLKISDKKSHLILSGCSVPIYASLKEIIMILQL